MGGLENATKALVAAALLRRLGLLRVGIAGVGTAAAASTGQLVAMGAAANTTAGSVGRLATLARGLNVATIAGFAAVVGAQALHAQFDEPNTITRQQLNDPAFRDRIRKTFGADALARLDAAVAGGTTAGPAGDRPIAGEGARTRPITGTGTAGGATSTGTGLSRFQRLSLAFDEAQLSKGLQDDLAAAKALETYYARIASNERLKGDKLFEARQNLIAARSRTQSIEDQIAADQQAADQQASEKRKATIQRRARAAEQEAREQQDAYRRMIARRTVDPEIADKIAMRAGRTARNRGTASTAGGGLTEADFRRLSFDFLSSLHGVVGQFGGNTVDPGWGQMATQSYAQTQLMREQNRMIEGLSSSVKSPGSRYAKVELTASGWGVGY
jgi:hypothetical protein